MKGTTLVESNAPVAMSTRSERSPRLTRVLAAVVIGALPAWLGWTVWNGWTAQRLWSEARAAASAENWTESATKLDKIQAIRPLDRDQNRLRVQAALALGDSAAAIDALNRVPLDDPELELAWMSRGRLLMEQFRFRDAEKMFRRCVARNPKLDEARIQLIIIAGLKRKYREFEKELWGFFDQCGEPLAPLRMLARGVAMLPDRTTIDRTLDEGDLLRRGLAADPNDAELRPPLARYYLARGDAARALELLESWLEAHPDDAASRVEWLACRLEQGQTEQVRPWLEQPHSEFESYPRYWTILGDFRQRTGRPAEAAKAFARASEIESRDPESRFRMGMALRAAGKTEEAEAALAWVQKANQLKIVLRDARDPTPDPAALEKAGLLCREMSREREARAWFRAALRAAPDDAELAKRLGDVREP